MGAGGVPTERNGKGEQQGPCTFPQGEVWSRMRVREHLRDQILGSSKSFVFLEGLGTGMEAIR